MWTFKEILQILKNKQAYQMDVEKGIVLGKEQIGEAIAANFEDALDAYADGSLQQALAFDDYFAKKLAEYQKYSIFEAIFRLQYDYNPTLSFSYRSFLVLNFLELGDLIQQGKVAKDEAYEILQNHLISLYLTLKGIKDIDAKLLSLIQLAEEVAKEEPELARYLIGYTMGQNKAYTYKGQQFLDLETFYVYLSNKHSLEKFADTFANDKQFMGWLYYLGYAQQIQKWSHLVDHFAKEKNKYSSPIDMAAKLDIQPDVMTLKAEKIDEESNTSDSTQAPVSEEVELSEYNKWLNSPKVSSEMKQVMQNMTTDQKLEAFGQVLEFGTAGLRGIIAPGSNKMNIFTIRKAALAYAQYCLKYVENCRTKGLVIACDNRHMSQEFVHQTAAVFISQGIKTMIFPHIVSTPELSFAIRHLQTAGGVVITASHNPKEYNGFKVYNQEGCQLVPAEIDKLLEFYQKILDLLAIEVSEIKESPLLISLDESIDVAYYQAALKVSLNKELNPANLKVVYSSEHGAGYRGVRYVMQALGYSYYEVEKQIVEDPDFSETLSPNPEEKTAYTAALQLAKKQNADIVIVTDPDADRVGVVVFDNREPVYLTGNQTGALLIDYLIKTHKNMGNFKENSVLFKTIVTSDLGAKIANDNGVEVVSTLTGFKYIGEQIALLPKTKHFFFGYEESYGYLLLPTSRDKDALQAIVAICEMTNYYKTQAQTLVDVLASLSKLYGYHLEVAKSVYFTGSDASKKMNNLLERFRQEPPVQLGGKKVVTWQDYQTGISKTGEVEKKITLPQSNVLRYILDNGSTIAIRPSGTEPKCKFYYNIVAQDQNGAEKLCEDIQQSIAEILKKD